MNNANTSGVGLLSKRVRKVPSSQVSPERYNWLNLEETEPDLGVSTVNGSVLVSNINGERIWSDTVVIDEDGNLVLDRELNVSNIKLDLDTITTVNPNSNLYLSANGSGSIHFLNDVKHFGSLYVNNGNLNSNNVGFNLLNTTVQTINFGGAANSITVGYANTDVLIPGNLTVTGEYVYNTPQISVIEDYILVLGSTPTPLDSTSNGGGIELLGTTTKSLKWYDETDAWTSSENFDLASGKSYLINGSNVLSATTLGSSVIHSALTSVGTVTSGIWRASTIAPTYGGTGLINYNKGDLIYSDSANSLNSLGIGPIGSVLVSNGSLPVWDTSLSLVGNLSTTGTISVNNTTVSTNNINGALVVQGGVGIGGALYAGSIQNTPIGNISKNSAGFTLLTANNTVTFTKNQSSSSTTTGTLIVTGGAGFSENVNIGNNLSAGGTVAFGDRAITIGGLQALTTNDNKDRGIEFRWHNGSVSKLGFFGFSNSTGSLTYIPDATNTDEVFTGSKGVFDAYVDWNNIQNIPPVLESGGFDTVIVTDTSTGFTWADTGTATTAAGNSLTLVSGPGIDIDIDETDNGVLISHADTSSVTNLTQTSRTYVSGLTFDTYGHVLTYSTATETDVTNITNVNTNGIFYPVFSSVSTGTAPELSVSTSKLTYNPSLGILTTVDLNTTSDISLKENITDIDNPLDIVRHLNGKTFNWKDTGRKSFGLIAQEIEQVLPELVHESTDGIKHVSYIPLIAFLIEAVKDLQEQITELKSS